MDINLIDVAIIGFTLFFAYKGYIRGFIKVTLSLVSILLAFYISFLFYSDLSIYVDKVADNLSLSNVISFVVIFIVANYLMSRFGDFIETLLDKLYLGSINSLMGAILNAFKGILIISFVLFVLSGFSYNSSFSSLLKGSKVSPVLLASFNKLVSFINDNMPSDLQRRWSEYEEKLKKPLENK